MREIGADISTEGHTTSKELVASTDSLERVSKTIDTLFRTGARHILLRGELASGKTTLVRSYALFRGISAPITSPTFSLLHSYARDFHHYDLYNRDLDELLALGLLEMLQEEGIHLIEWGDERLENLLKRVGFPTGIVTILPHKQGRLYRITHA